MRQCSGGPIASRQACSPLFNTIRRAPIRVRGVVVVGVASRVDIPRIVRVATIGRTQTTVLCFQPTSLGS